MLTLKDILSTLVERVRKEFKDIPINTQDIEENIEDGKAIKGKVFYIYFHKVKASDYMKKFSEKNLSVNIVYFPSSRQKNTIEILDIQDRLMQIFSDNNSIELKNGIFSEILEVETNRVGGVLHFDFDMYVFEEYPAKEHENMENIEIEGVE